MKTPIASLALLLVISTASASAAPIKSKIIEAQHQDLTVPLSPNQLDAEIQLEHAQRQRAEAPTSSLEVGSSSWMPQDLQIASRLPGTTEFERAGIPAMFLQTLHPVGYELKLRLGVGLLSARRFAPLNAAGMNRQQEETAYVTTFRVGAEYRILRLSNRTFSPYVAGTLLPTAIVTGRSALNEGTSAFGVGFEASAGTLVRFAEGWDLNLGAAQTLGKVQGSSLSGFGVNGAVRMHL